MTSLPRSLLGRIALWGFLLNMLWEFGQCVFLYEMWDWRFWRAAAWMWGAIFGDVLIVLGVALTAYLLVGASHIAPPDAVGWAALLGVGLTASIALEWLARTLHLWSYSDLMPTLEIFGHVVGLSPIAQITALPALSVYVAARRSPM